MSAVLERFFRYVRYDTQADESSDTYPSTSTQLVLLRELARELEALGAADVRMDAHGYVTATVPATSPKPHVPTIGFIAHVDTSPEMSGAGVTPLVHRGYDGRDIVLPDDPTAVLRRAENAALAERIGDDIVTASGTTLLGADNKAGVAEIMTAVEHLLAHPEIPHGVVRVAFMPDEEVGRGTKYFDVTSFGARCAYTMDGGSRGDLEGESFSADAMTLTFSGFNTHPGYAKARMVNAIKVAAAFIDALPADRLSPETTDGREGFVHPYAMQASVDRTSVRFIVRDFDTAGLKEKETWLASLAEQTVTRFDGARVAVSIEEQYRNMREVLDRHPAVVEHAREAMRRAGLTVRERPIRGGTDGSRLSFMGLPTPNIFAGEHNFHSRLEWVSVQDMEKAVEVIVQLARVWEERAREHTKMKPKNTICLWFNQDAHEAARFYAATFPDSKVTATHKAPGDYPGGKEGDVLTVEFTVLGIPCLGLNGGPEFRHSEAFSFQIATDNQEETDRYWNALVGNGGTESQCGWCKDRWGLAWQITPRALTDALAAGGGEAKRAFEAMMPMKKIDIATIEAARRG